MSRSTRKQDALHWADATARRVRRPEGGEVLSTGISPSGPIHVGNLREVLTAEAVHRALQDLGVDPGFHFVADDLDPLRRVYPFLDPATYEPLVGRPLADICCPCGEHASYARHFLDPFLQALEALEIAPEVIPAHELYRSGKMNEVIGISLEARDRIARILVEVTGKAVAEDWSPLNLLCPECGKYGRARLRSFDRESETVSLVCACGAEDEVPFHRAGKLTWRVDWPARWKVLGVTVEPFGKDHATRGGSYDSGRRIAREVFGVEPPHPIPYEWIRLVGAGDMSSSRGNVLSVAEMVEAVPPDVLRYAVLREKPSRSINFDPGLPLLRIWDEVNGVVAPPRDPRALELSRTRRFVPLPVPMRHLIVVAQAANFATQRVLEILRRTGYGDPPEADLETHLRYARRWLERFAPEDVRFTVPASLPGEAEALSALQRRFLARLADELHPGMTGQEIHERIYALAGSLEGDAPVSEMFKAIYRVLLGKDRGPRAGSFIEVLGVEFCRHRFLEAAKGEG